MAVGVPPAKRKRRGRLGFLTGDGLKNLGMVAGILVTLWQGFAAGRKADSAEERARAADRRSKAAREATAAVAALAAGEAGSDSALAEKLEDAIARIGRLEGALLVMNRRMTAAARPQMGARIGPEPAPAWYKPERRGLLSRLFGNSGR